jgi:hypothetical protein
MADTAKLDEDLQRILEAASQRNSLPVELQLPKPVQSFAWPWQVPQVPSYTSDHAPSSSAK